MRTGRALQITHWMRQRQMSLAAVLAVIMLFNAVQALAGVLSESKATASMAMLDDVQHKHSTCCGKHAQHHNDCFQSAGCNCNCSAHCAFFLSSHIQLNVHGVYQSKPLQLSQITPIPHVFPPPQRPPQA